MDGPLEVRTAPSKMIDESAPETPEFRDDGGEERPPPTKDYSLHENDGNGGGDSSSRSLQAETSLFADPTIPTTDPVDVDASFVLTPYPTYAYIQEFPPLCHLMVLLLTGTTTAYLVKISMHNSPCANF